MRLAETFVNVLVLRLFDAVKANSPYFYFILPLKFDSKRSSLLRPTLDTGSISLFLILTDLHC